MAMERALNTEEAAKALGVSKQTIYRYIGDGTLRPCKVGRQNRFPEHQIAELLGTKCTHLENDREEHNDNVVQLVPAGENKQEFCSRYLLPLLRHTRPYPDLESLEYEERNRGLETVKAVFEDGTIITIDVTGSSNFSLVSMVMNGLASAFTSNNGRILR